MDDVVIFNPEVVTLSIEARWVYAALNVLVKRFDSGTELKQGAKYLTEDDICSLLHIKIEDWQKVASELLDRDLLYNIAHVWSIEPIKPSDPTGAERQARWRRRRKNNEDALRRFYENSGERLEFDDVQQAQDYYMGKYASLYGVNGYVKAGLELLIEELYEVDKLHWFDLALEVMAANNVSNFRYFEAVIKNSISYNSPPGTRRKKNGTDPKKSKFTKRNTGQDEEIMQQIKQWKASKTS